MALEYKSDNFSAFLVAMFFGVISPKISINTVNIPVAIPAPILVLPSNPIRWQIWKAYAVEREEADRFTMLLQINTALSILEGSSTNFKTRLAALLFSSAKARIRILFTVVNAVSADEKKADKISNVMITSIFIASLGLKVSSPLSINA